MPTTRLKRLSCLETLKLVSESNSDSSSNVVRFRRHLLVGQLDLEYFVPGRVIGRPRRLAQFRCS